MKKIMSITSLLLVFCLLFTACDDKNSDIKDKDKIQQQIQSKNGQNTVNVLGLKGPTSIGMIKMINDKSLNNDMYCVNYETVDAPDMILGKLINNEVQIAAVPTNLASVLYNKTNGNIQFLALNTLGVLYAVGSDEEIKSLDDLEGKKVVISGKGSVPEYAMNYLLEQKGLKDKVKLDYVADHATCAQALLAGDADVAILPQPYVTQVTMKSNNVKILINLNNVWDDVSEHSSVLAMGCLVVNKEFASKNKDFINDFLTSYEESVNFVNDNPKEASVMVEKNGVIQNAELVEKAIPNCSIVYKNAQDAKDEVTQFLTILYNSDKKSVGGKLPDEKFFYQN